MGGYFKPLRRKVGIVTLALACLFAVEWVRSQAGADLVQISNGSLSCILASSDGKCRVIFPRELTVELKVMDNIQGRQYWDLGQPSSENRSIHFRSTNGRFIGATYGTKGDQLSALPYWYLLSYWHIVIPLTLLSAWLLLSKPRSMKSGRSGSALIVPHKYASAVFGGICLCWSLELDFIKSSVGLSIGRAPSLVDRQQSLAKFALRICVRVIGHFLRGPVMSVVFSELLNTAEFGDQRLTNRLVSIVDRLEQKPNMSIPAAMNGRAEMEAAYRFFDNVKVTPDAIMEPHLKATEERIGQCDVVLLVQDTTQVDLTRPGQQVQGAGPMACESRRGFFYHPLFAFDAQGLPLGTAWSQSWTREERAKELTRKEYLDQLRIRPIEEKESQCWIDGLRAARHIAQICPQTECICVCDSESDVYEFFAEPRTLKDGGEVHLLVRACQNRTLTEPGNLLRDRVQATPCLYECQVDVKRRSQTKTSVEDRRRKMPRDARVAQVQIRACTVTLRSPRRHDRKLPQVTLNVVFVTEPSPPEGQIPLEWILVTTLPIRTIQQIQLIVHYYSLRWQIEVYFKTLKSGCRIECRYFERLGRLQNCLAVYTIIAWKVFYLCRLGHECPDLNCEIIYEPNEWKPVYMAITKRQPPSNPPSLYEMTRMVASLGGYVIRKSTRPGTQTLWFGLQRLHDLSMAWTTFGPEA